MGIRSKRCLFAVLISAGCAMEEGGPMTEPGVSLRAEYAGAIGFTLDEDDLMSIDIAEGEELVVIAGGLEVKLAGERPTVDLAIADGEELPLYAVTQATRRRIGQVRVTLLSDDSLMEDGAFEEAPVAASCAHMTTRWLSAGTCEGTCRATISCVRNGHFSTSWLGRQRQQMCIYGSWYWTSQYRCVERCC
jgi:hypothetical protein